MVGHTVRTLKSDESEQTGLLPPTDSKSALGGVLPERIRNFPKVAIIDANPGRMTTPETLESLSLVGPEDLAPTVVRFKTSGDQSRLGTERSWRDYQRCLLAAPPASSGNGPSRSHADFTWCMMAAQRGHGIEDIANKLFEVSAEAQERARLHDEGYALVTAQNAAAAAERGRTRGRG